MEPVYPGREWERVSAAHAGFDARKLDSVRQWENQAENNAGLLRRVVDALT
jgi:hypothetical protein